MLRNVVIGVILSVGVMPAEAQAPKRLTEEGAEEVLWLDRAGSPESWSPVEECRVRPSDLTCPMGGPGFHMYFGIDHHDGEKAYPIGWPRAHMNLQGWERDWSQWDRFEFMVLARTSRPKLPQTALSLEIGEVRPTFRPPLELKETGKWLKVTVPVADIAKSGDLIERGIPRLRFVVTESNYKDRDVVEFHVGGFRLARSLECSVSQLALRTPVVYAGQPFVKLDVTVVGPPADVKRGVPFTIRDQHNVVRRETLPLGRGVQVYECDVSELQFAPGVYELVVFERDAAKRKSLPLRVVEQPWTQQ